MDSEEEEEVNKFLFTSFVLTFWFTFSPVRNAAFKEKEEGRQE